MSALENILFGVIRYDDPLFESPENWDFTCEDSIHVCYTLTNTEYTKLVFSFNGEQSCENAIYSRTWSSKH